MYFTLATTFNTSYNAKKSLKLYNFCQKVHLLGFPLIYSLATCSQNWCTYIFFEIERNKYKLYIRKLKNEFRNEFITLNLWINVLKFRADLISIVML